MASYLGSSQITGVYLGTTPVSAIYVGTTLAYSANPTFVGASPSSAAAGSTITITGTNFVSGSTTVTIGGVSATNVSVSGTTSLTCRVPSLSRGSKSIVISTPSGSTTASNAFTVLTPPTLSAISPSSGTTGTSVTITGSNFLSGASVTFAGVNAGNVSVVNSSTITCTAPSLGSQGNKTVTVSTSDGSASGTFTFSLAPTVGGVSPTTIKAGDTVTVTGTNFVSGSTVKIGNDSATNVSVTSSTSLTCRVPAISAGQSLALGLTVTTPGGSASTSPTALLYYPAPVFSSVSIPQGKSGLAVTITGTGFSGSVSATVGGVAAPVSVSSPTSLNLTIPTISTEGAKSIVITTPGGSVTGSNVFTYYNSYSPSTTNYTAAGSFTFTIPAWCNKIDIIGIGAGFSGANGSLFVTGPGGEAGSWATTTLTRGSSIPWSTTTLSGQVGQSTSGSIDAAKNPSKVGNFLTAAGGDALVSTLNGGSPGNTTFNGVTYVGGIGGTPNTAVTAPGAGGRGGAIFNGPGENGANGAVWFRCYQ